MVGAHLAGSSPLSSLLADLGQMTQLLQSLTIISNKCVLKVGCEYKPKVRCSAATRKHPWCVHQYVSKKKSSEAWRDSCISAQAYCFLEQRF